MQQSYCWPIGEALKLQEQSEPQRAPSSSAPPHFCSHIYTSGGSCNCNPKDGGGQCRHAAQRVWLKTLPTVTSIKEWFGGGLWVVNRRESCVLELFFSGEHLDVLRRAWTSRDRNNDTSRAMTKRGQAGEGMELSNVNQHFGLVWLDERARKLKLYMKNMFRTPIHHLKQISLHLIDYLIYNLPCRGILG